MGAQSRSAALRAWTAAGPVLVACSGRLAGGGPADSGDARNPVDARGSEPSPASDASGPDASRVVDASGHDADGGVDARHADAGQAMDADGGGPSDALLPLYPDGPLGTAPGRCSGPTPADATASSCYTGAALVVCGAGTGSTMTCISDKLTCDKGADASAACGNVCSPNEYAAFCSLLYYDDSGYGGYGGSGGYGGDWTTVDQYLGEGCRMPTGMALAASSAVFLCCPCSK